VHEVPPDTLGGYLEQELVPIRVDTDADEGGLLRREPSSEEEDGQQEGGREERSGM
jgi:hypothetical protein